jgi:hypothetical protein
MHPVQKLAHDLDLPRVVDVLTSFPAALPDPAPPIAQPEGPALARAMRVGLAPDLHRALRDELRSAPLDLALMAWDLLHGALFAPDAPEVVALRELARAGGPLTAQPLRRWPRLAEAGTRSFLMESLRALSNLTDAALLAAANRFQLGACRHLMHRRGTEDSVLLERTRTYALVLQRARLTSLAAAHLDELYFGCGHRPALWNLVDVLLDSGATGVMAFIETLPGENDTIRPARHELLLYAKIREGLHEERAEAWREWSEKHRKIILMLPLSPEDRGRLDPLATIEYTEVALRLALPLLPLEVIGPAASSLPSWRHGFLVLTLAAARMSNPRSRDFLEVLDKQLEQFGNDQDLWWSLGNLTPPKAAWGLGMVTKLLRETVGQPHDPEVWKGVARVFGLAHNVKPAIEEIDARLAAQACLDG